MYGGLGMLVFGAILLFVGLGVLIWALNLDRETKNEEKARSIPVKYVFYGLAVIVLVLFIIAAISIQSGGSKIMEIQSVGGRTLEEAYYYELGSIYTGYAMISVALGIFFSSILIWLGIKSDEEKHYYGNKS